MLLGNDGGDAQPQTEAGLFASGSVGAVEARSEERRVGKECRL